MIDFLHASRNLPHKPLPENIIETFNQVKLVLTYLYESIEIKLKSVQSSEHINEKGDGSCHVSAT